MRPTALTALLTLFIALPLWAAEPTSGTYKVDTGHSTTLFRIKHVGVAYFYGRFNLTTGQVTWNAEDPSKSKIDVTVDANSVYTASRKRDLHLKGPDFFDVKQFPKITFKSKKITGIKKSGKDWFRVTGDLTLHGVTKEVTATFQLTGYGQDPWKKLRLGAEATFTIKRSEFGIKHLLGGLSDEVRLIVSLSTVKQK